MGDDVTTVFEWALGALAGVYLLSLPVSGWLVLEAARTRRQDARRR